MAGKGDRYLARRVIGARCDDEFDPAMAAWTTVARDADRCGLKDSNLADTTPAQGL